MHHHAGRARTPYSTTTGYARACWGYGGGCVDRDTAAVPTGPPQSGGWEHVASAQHGGAMGSLEPHLFPVGEHPPPATVSAVATPTTAVNTARSSGVIVSLSSKDQISCLCTKPVCR